MNTIIYTVIAALAVGFVLGLLLGLFKKVFAVHVDPKVQEIRSCLSGGNCGGCGYAGCDAFAQAVAAGLAPVTGCIAGGASCADAIARIMGVDAGSAEKKIAFLACRGTKECAKDKASYIGIKTCKAVQLTMNGTKACAFGCIGFGDCTEVCPFGALSMGKDGLPVINRKKCVGCGKCASVCPKHLFKIIPADLKGSIAQCSCLSDNKVQIRKDCTAGCFKCGMCAKKCPEQCIDLSGGLPVIDYTKCTGCGECAKACVDKVFVIL